MIEMQNKCQKNKKSVINLIDTNDWLSLVAPK